VLVEAQEQLHIMLGRAQAQDGQRQTTHDAEPHNDNHHHADNRAGSEEEQEGEPEAALSAFEAFAVELTRRIRGELGRRAAASHGRSMLCEM
jgi:hypothetical protein